MAGKHSYNEKRELPKAMTKEAFETNQNKKKKKSKFRLFLKILLVLIILLAIFLGGVLWFINNKLGKMQKISINEAHLGISKVANANLSEYRNIAIFGIDSRQDNYNMGNRSDCIIIASMNNNTKETKLISVYRDTYVQIDGHGLDKITHAYSYGSAQLAINTLNTNFDLNIKEFITLNFDAVKNIVDSIGGISMKITSEEVSHIPGINQAGTYNLTGEQALAYARIRYATGGDYKRTERMRDVLTAVVNKAKTLDITKLYNLVNKILPEIYTNITITDILSLLPNITNFKISDSIGYPFDTKGITLDKWYSVPVTLESNVIKLHKEIFGQQDYIPTETTKTISNQIIQKTGYTN